MENKPPVGIDRLDLRLLDILQRQGALSVAEVESVRAKERESRIARDSRESPPVLAAIGPVRLGGALTERLLLTGSELDAESAREAADDATGAGD